MSSGARRWWKTGGPISRTARAGIITAAGSACGGQVVGRTDDLGLAVVADKVHVHDLQATILHCLGLNHERLTFRYQGRDFRLTDIGGQVVRKLLS